jgi:hypothetical protein
MGLADFAAQRAAKVAAQGLGLLAGPGLQRAGGQSRDGGQCDFFHLVQIDVEAGPVIAEGLPDNDFSPLPGELLDAFEVGSCQLP